MEPQIKNVLWFASAEGATCAYSAAQWAMENAGVKMQTCYSAKIPYSEGTLTRPDGCAIKIFILPLTGKFSEQARAIAQNAHAILLSGTCVGRPGAVKLGDVIGVTGCYHIDKGARIHSNNAVDFNISPVFAKEVVISRLLKVQQEASIEHSHALPVSIETRRDWVLDYVHNANTALQKAEFFPIATDQSLDDAARNKQWKKTVVWLINEGLISLQQGNIALTVKGKDYCQSNVLASFTEQQKNAHLHIGSIVTSTSVHADLKQKEDWTKFDTPNMSPLALDNDAYDMLKEYPNLCVVQAVRVIGQEKIAGDTNNVIQKAAAPTLMHVISRL